MGTFIGHILAGLFLCSLGIFDTFIIAFVRLQNGNKIARHYRTSAPMSCCPRLPIVPLYKILCCSIGVIWESKHAMRHDDHVEATGIQHASMYAMFCAAALVEIITLYTNLLPIGADYFATTLAFIIECLVFVAHNAHNENIVKMVHTLQICVIFACALSTIIEALAPAKLDLKFVRAYLTALQGTWFCQIAFLLFDPHAGGIIDPWRSSVTEADNLWISTFFAWHCLTLGLFFALCIIATTIFAKARENFVPSDHCIIEADVDLLNHTLRKNGSYALLENTIDE